MRGTGGALDTRKEETDCLLEPPERKGARVAF